MSGDHISLEETKYLRAEIEQLRAERDELLAAVFSIDSEIVLEGQLKEMVDTIIAKAEGQ
jgi:hypothetical protein